MSPTYSDSPSRSEYDAIVVGSGPNGLSAAIVLAQQGASVLVIEARNTPGGGTRTQEVTLPGFAHDICSAVHPMACASPFFQSLGLEKHGLEWIHAEYPIAHPLDAGRAAIQERSVEATANRLGLDGAAYARMFDGLVRHADSLYEMLLGPLRWPASPLLLANFGRRALFPALLFAHHQFSTEEGKALFGGHAAHSVQKLENLATAAFGLMLGMTAHHVGWPVAKGGSQRIADALVAVLESGGGELVCNRPVDSLEALPKANVLLFDTSPGPMARICGDRLPKSYREALQTYRHGPASFKVDWALRSPIPWQNADCGKAATVHVGGTLEEVGFSERDAWEGRHSSSPFLILVQPTICDPSRAPEGQHIAWAYCHVPKGSTVNMVERIEDQVERFAPGFRDCILERHLFSPTDFENYNANYVDGDIVGGVADLRQLYTRPVGWRNPYQTPAKDIFICSASTPPGAGVHGMCGFHAGQAALAALQDTGSG